MKATPGPIVSGRYFLPNAPVLWTKRMPAACVMSRNRVPEAGLEAGALPLANTTRVTNRSAPGRIDRISPNPQCELIGEHPGAGPGCAHGSPGVRCCLPDSV